MLQCFRASPVGGGNSVKEGLAVLAYDAVPVLVWLVDGKVCNHAPDHKQLGHELPCKLVDFKRVLNVCRGSAIFCQIIVQSIPQLQDRYLKTEWEELIGCTDIQICLGCNDVDTATYISKKCGILSFSVCFFMVCNLLSLRVRASL